MFGAMSDLSSGKMRKWFLYLIANEGIYLVQILSFGKISLNKTAFNRAKQVFRVAPPFLTGKVLIQQADTMNVLGPSLAPHVRSSRTLKKYVTPIAHWYADLMGYRKMGLKYDDLRACHV
jgi:hypothetical protein